MGRYREAEPLYRESLEKVRRVHGEEHARTILALNNLAMLLQSQGKPADAEKLFRESLAKQRRITGDDSEEVLLLTGNLASCLQAEQKQAEPEKKRPRSVLSILKPVRKCCRVGV